MANQNEADPSVAPGYWLDPRNWGDALSNLLDQRYQSVLADNERVRQNPLGRLMGETINAMGVLPVGRAPMQGQFKSPWGFENYPVTDPVQHMRNLRTAIGQHARDITEFNKLYPGETHPSRATLQQLRQELKDVQANFGGE